VKRERVHVKRESDVTQNTQRSKFNYQDVVLRENRSGGSFAKRKTDGVGERLPFQFVLITFSNAGK